MDQTKMVNRRIEEARKLIDRLGEDQQFIVTDAFWSEDMDEREWILNVASPVINEIGTTRGYGVLTLAFNAHPEIELDPDEVRPRRIDDPVVVEALDFLRRYPAAEAFRLGGVYLKGHFIQWACLYPVLLDGKTGAEIRAEALGVG